MKNFSDSIKYIGVDDTDIDLFEGQYVVPAGMAYNSFVIDDEKIAVTDTVDSRKVTVSIDSEATDYICQKGMAKDYGGREIEMPPERNRGIFNRLFK